MRIRGITAAACAAAIIAGITACGSSQPAQHNAAASQATQSPALATQPWQATYQDVYWTGNGTRQLTLHRDGTWTITASGGTQDSGSYATVIFTPGSLGYAAGHTGLAYPYLVITRDVAGLAATGKPHSCNVLSGNTYADPPDAVQSALSGDASDTAKYAGYCGFGYVINYNGDWILDQRGFSNPAPQWQTSPPSNS